MDDKRISICKERNCIYASDGWRDEGCFCYMFKEAPDLLPCSQFQAPMPPLRRSDGK